VALDDTPESPDWWLTRHGRRLRARREKLDYWWRYYSGDQPMPQGPEDAVLAYLNFQRMSQTNFIQMVVDATVHRAVVMGVNASDGTQDAASWTRWQANRLDARQAQVYRLALSQSVAYVSVGMHPRREGQALIVAEHPRQTITEESPETGEVISGAKFWYDPVLRRARCNVYLPDRTVRYITKERAPGDPPVASTQAWGRMADDQWPDGELPHDMGIVPLVPFKSRYDLGEEPEADFARVIPVQDRINLGVLNRMTAERYGAFRQKYVTGFELEAEVDEVTGLPVKPKMPFKLAPGELMVTPDPDVKFGEFSQTDLSGYLRSHEADVRAMLLLTHTPGYYYATDLVNLSADAVTALDINHVAKVKQLQAEWGEAWEDVLRLAALVVDDTADRDSIEVRWQDPRSINPSVLADQAVKLQQAGYPLAVIAEKTGESPQRIQAITGAAASQALLTNALTAAPVPASAAQPPVPGV
jgi:hypothetical protein